MPPFVAPGHEALYTPLAIRQRDKERVDLKNVVISTIVSIASGAITAYITTRLKMSEERKKWEREITLKYVEAAAENRQSADTLARQFAVGFLIVHQPGAERSKVFVPKGSRITIGRDAAQCQVVLHDPCVSGLSAMVESDGTSIFLLDLYPTNGIRLNGELARPGSRSRLESGDVVSIGNAQLTFQGMERTG